MIQPNKILAVDDEPGIREMYRDLLGELGFDVRTVGTIADAAVAVALRDQHILAQGSRPLIVPPQITTTSA
jgi:DNA-binding NtrC family response regulator